MALFITLEGVEGSGKTLQMQMLEEDLTRRGVGFMLTREPGGTAFGKQLREILLRHDEIEREPLSELLLYLADRYQHLKEVVEPHLDRGMHVLSDRYHDATVAYQGYAREIGMKKVAELALLLGIRKPDLTLVLDLPAEVGLQRARARNRTSSAEIWGRFESEELSFHEKVREGYHVIAAEEPERVVLIDGTGSPSEVFRQIEKTLEERGLFLVS